MPGKVGVKIKAGRNLPVMDRSSDTTDAYVEIKLGNVTHKTDVCRKSLNPQWNTDWYRFEVDDAELQDEPLQIRLMDHDTYSANDAIGKVNISLNPLCLENAGHSNPGKGAVMSGWIPVFDTMHGIRGEVNIIVKVDLFSDANKFRQSSCGVQFFHSPNVPHGYRAQVIHGFVEELVVNDDPEYQWIDKIRTPRASNEARQVVFLKLSGQVQRKIGLKAINLGANAVIGYTQCFDLEGDVGVVARGIGTAVTLIKILENMSQPLQDSALIEERTLKYLEFLKGSGSPEGFCSSKFDSETLSSSPGNLVYKILGIEPLEKCCTKAPNVILNKKWKPSAKDNIILEETFNSETEGMKQLFDQEDMRGEKPTKRFKHQMKKITHSSRSLLNEKFSAFKAKLSDEKFSEKQSVSLNSSYSDISCCESNKGSMSDIRGIIGLRKKKKFNRSVSDGFGMTTLLVNSLMHGPSLDSISEGHDSGKSSPGQTLNPKKEMKSESLGYIPEGIKDHKTFLSPNLQKKTLHISDASISTTSISSSTEEEGFSDECSETTTPNEILVVDADTVSMVVKSVLAQESVDKDADNWIVPGSTQKINENVAKNDKKSGNLNFAQLSDSNSQCYNSPSNVGIITGGTRILKKDKDSDITESELFKNAPNSEKLEKILKAASIDEDSENWIEPGSTTDEPEKIEVERRGSILHDIKENLTEKFHHLQEHIHLPHFSDDKSKMLKHGLLETAMETMLIEKAEILGADPDSISEPNKSEPSSPTNDKHENRRGSIEIFHKKIHIPFYHNHKNSEREIKHDTGLLGNAISAMLMEQVNLAEEICEHPIDAIKTEKYIEDGNKIDDPETSLSSLHEDKSTNSKKFKQFEIPAISLTSLQEQPTTVADVNKDNSFYSSEPQLSQIMPSSSTTPLGMPFISLTNLNTSSVNRMLLELNPSPNNVLISSSDPTPIPNCLELNNFIMLSSKESNIKKLPSNESINSQCIANNNNNNILSSSYSNLSTNKAPMLAPFPFLKHHRSELVSASTSPGANKMLPSGHTRADSAGCKMSQSPAKIGNSTPVNSMTTSTATGSNNNKETGICRRSSDSDLTVTPKGNSLCVASERLVAATGLMRLNAPSNLKSAMNQENLDMLEYPFLTMAKYPLGFIVHLGATVAARSVKLLERVPNQDEPETRDSWWTELRMEIRSHARALCCNVVLAYSEVTTISDDVCVLSATGTAAIINMSYSGDPGQFEFPTNSKKDVMVSSLDERECAKDIKTSGKIVEVADGLNGSKEFSISLGGGGATKIPLPPLPQNLGCSMCHIPYSQASIPFNVKMKKCDVCKRGKVPDVLLATIEIPECLQITGRGCFMQAQVVRAKKDLRSESNAKEISDGLPFLEYELHRLLINKLKAKGMNAIFGLKAHVAIGEKMMALIATGTAVFLSALPPPAVPKIVAGNSWTDTAKLNELQKSLQETVERNREIYQLKSIDPDEQNGKQSDTDDSEDEVAELDLTTGSKDTCVLEVDDIEDLEIISLLMEPCPPEGFHVVNTQSVPGLQDMEVIKNLQMFTQVWRAKLSVGQNIGGFPKHFQRLLQTIYFKLRSMIPCAICDLRFRLDLPESDEIQILVTGMALGLGEVSKLTKIRRKALSATNSVTLNSDNVIITNGITNVNKKSQDDELIFSLDEDQSIEITNFNQSQINNTNYGTHSIRLRKTSPPKMKFSSVRLSRHLPVRDRYGVDITPLSYVPGGKIEKYLGNLNFFFIRESTSIRENGGISGFVHSFITELLAVVRAHVSALGGNAMVSFYMTELILVDNQHKNQGQCLISIGGDVVYVSYFTDE